MSADSNACLADGPESFWTYSAPPYTPSPPLRQDIAADVVVVGAGYAGLSTALHIKEAQPGWRVVVLEDKHVGFGASGRNAGFAMTLFGLALPVTKLLYGGRNARQAHEFMIEAVECVGRLVRKHGMDADFWDDGALMAVAATPEQARHLEREVALARSLGLEGLDWLDAEGARAEVGTSTYLAAKRDRHFALLHPLKYARELKRAAVAAGVEVYEDTRAVAWSEDEQGVRVETPQGRVSALHAVLATNAYAPFKPLRRKQIPIHTYIAVTQPLTEDQLKAMGWKNRHAGVEDSRFLVHYYRLVWDAAAGAYRLLMGGGDALYYAGDAVGVDQDSSRREALRAHIEALFPCLKGVRVDFHHGGPISGTLGMIPRIGRAGARTFYVLGCMGHGVAFTTYAGVVLKDLVLKARGAGADTPLTRLFFIDRWTPAIPLLRWARCAIVGSILAGMRWLDRSSRAASRRA